MPEKAQGERLRLAKPSTIIRSLSSLRKSLGFKEGSTEDLAKGLIKDLLKQLGLRLDRTKLKLEMEAREESIVPFRIGNIERWVYPALRTLIQQRAKLGVAPP